MTLDLDTKYMKIALNIARQNEGFTSPNPNVSCVIVKGGRIISTGVTGYGGSPHAESVALQKAKESNVDIEGSCVYVTLEPCFHHGKTPPCVESLIQAKISRVVIAVQDPFSKVAGRSIAKLKEAGIEVVLDVCKDEALRVNEGFFSVQLKRRPFITLKLATSLDGKIALKNGLSKWITGDIARNYAHLLRAKNDAILVGSGTLKSDDPSLDCRLNGLEDKSPIRVIATSKKDIPNHFKIFKSNSISPIWLATGKSQLETKALNEKWNEVIYCEEEGGLEGKRLDLQDLMHNLSNKGITRLLCEGGSSIATSLLDANLVDRLIWIKAPKIIGGDGILAISDLKLDVMSNIKNFKLMSSRKLGSDIVEVYF